MGIEDVVESAERIGEADERRRSTFRRELAAYDDGALETFSGTRDAIADERAALERLSRALDAERENAEELASYSAFLTVDQATEHREKTLEKLDAHNEHLRTFHGEMAAALDAIEANLDALESDGPDAVEADPDQHFERAGRALEDHNAAVEGLGTSMTILNAYLV